MIRRPPRSTLSSSSAASDVYKRQTLQNMELVINLEYGKERVLTLLPVFHVYGMTNCVIFAVAVAATQIILPRFETDKVLEAIRKYQPTLFAGAPAMYMAINGHPRIAEYGLSLIHISEPTRLLSIS